MHIAGLVLALITIALVLGPVALGAPISLAYQNSLLIFDNAIHYALISLPWVIAGVILAGMSLEFIPRKWFAQELGGTGPRSVCKAGAMGVLLDVCSHCALTMGMSFYRSGASAAATITFLLATPWLGLMETMLMIGLLGWKITVALVVSSILVAVIVGLILGVFERNGWIETHKKKVKAKKINIYKTATKSLEAFTWAEFPPRFVSAVKKGLDLFSGFAGWFLIGFTASGVLLTFVTPEQITSLLGYANTMGIPYTVVVATIIEACSEGLIFIGAAFNDMGASIGAIFVFFMVGVASDVTELGVINEVIGKRAAIATVGVAIPVSMAFAYALNWIWVMFVL
ncbi:permease [archaeon]